MTEVSHEQRTSANSFAWPMPSMPSGNPVLAVATDINGKLLESAASAQKDWAEFVHRRINENVAASQRLMNCKSLTDVQEVYTQYLLTALEHYREQSEKVVQTGKSITEGLAQTIESRVGEVAQQTRH
jgi:aspartyl/asparaginyl beta-hydroxylase (cupin superfamily)